MSVHDHFGPQPVFSSCLHRHIQVVYNGSRSFSEGEVFDDIQEQVFCLECMQTLTEAEVRATWNGYSNFGSAAEPFHENR